MKKMNKVSRQICIYPEDWEKFLELREELGVGFSRFGRIAVHEYLEKIRKKYEK